MVAQAVGVPDLRRLPEGTAPADLDALYSGK